MPAEAATWVVDATEANFEQEVIEKSKSVAVVVDFWAAWCGPCRALAPLLEKAIGERNGDIVLAKVDVDANPRLAQQFQVSSIPLVLAFRNGQVVNEFSGVLSDTQLKLFLDQLGPSEIDRLIKDGQALESKKPAEAEALYRKALEQDRRHDGARIALARLVLSQGKDDEAERVLEEVGAGDEAERLRAMIALHRLARPFGDEQAVRQRLEKEPKNAEAQYQLGCLLATRGSFTEALEALFAAGERDFKLAGTKVREAMVLVFHVAGDQSALANEYRVKLSRLLYRVEPTMLAESRLEHILQALPRLTVGVFGDLFLDKYLDLDAALTEPSLETGLDAYQVVGVRCYPGAAGTVINNLASLGIRRVVPLAVIGDDGEGYELRRALQRLPNVDAGRVFASKLPGFRTPTYTKPLLYRHGKTPRELNRLDIKNRHPQDMSDGLLLPALAEVWPALDALLVLDQVSEAECGVVTSAVRSRLADLGQVQPERWIVADSRERIGLFRHVTLKPNAAECLKGAATGKDVEVSARLLAERCGRPVFCTRSEHGMLLAEPEGMLTVVPGYPVTGPIDPVGAGDSSSAALACALAGGASLTEAAAFANLVASITIQQIGITGTATPGQIRKRYRSV